MDIISQLQEQANSIALIAMNTFGTLQRDAPPVRLSPNYPEPPANPTEETINITEQPKIMSAALVQAAKKFDALIAALPLEGGEEAQVKRIAELQAENEVVGLELQKQLEAAGTETGSGFVLSSFRQLFESEESRLIFSTVSKYLTPLVQSLIIHVSLLI
ncbi:mediator of RNA polymerase II transcription subunit 21 isoform X1 [Phalaenopsis equestris]|uniref:mediator of RNA polymerase II transcription subunit 21 isoform X1 n=1 Tax=Phalaenopsis equestris TaxID=78828 RepID=UPI0009E4A3DB|nr:mediator of RNA polymerase II transcription subunit 21 isoform X1 [Phalaenopsis equestris]XP_020571045.1 mediator of RNA polymerase II transcription subunit 21 isoform X1 [Phalaenopsis equestris]XP_020571046.1 mediator of RNA polymerase II transcription subunit 21 isoform X1 [Phalaenopsis equestris]XP_020571047.1 mediator of RNA polymerase II transcription subunit 21 isoform X1 [Phalaenopsis equestris]XP_020571048.1 mediator of RNA polymerase II transcription subunit 21 isoform X1 [Phalaenop